MKVPTRVQVRLDSDIANELGVEQLIEINNPLSPDQTIQITNIQAPTSNELLDLFAIIERDLLLPNGTLNNHKVQQVEGVLNVYP